MKSDSMRVSVIIPSYNRAELLPRALDSVYSQTRLPDEVLLIDDGSTDATRDLQARYPQVRWLHQQNQGVSAARNHGIRQSTGDWLALLDSDDAWHPQKLARQLAALAAAPALRVCHTDEIWIRNGRRVNPRERHAKRGGRIFRDCLPLCAISPSSVLLHREVFETVGLFDESLPACEDYDLWLRVCCRFDVLLVDERLLDKYGGHDDQLSRKHWGMDRFRIQALENIIRSDRLEEDDRQAAVEMLLQKIEIYLTGVRKRARVEEVEKYEAKRNACSTW